MNPKELQDQKLYAGFEGGAVYTAEHNGRFYVIIDEGTLADLLDEEEMADIELTKAIKFDTLQARTAYLRSRFRR